MTGNSSPQENSSPLSLQEEGRVDAICVQFEDAWRAGEEPSIESLWTGGSTPEEMHLLRELILLEIDLRSGSETPLVDDYLRRFPNHQQVVQDAFREYSTLHDGHHKYETGDSIGRYVVERLLGRGGFSSVYLARDVEVGRPVAIKVPRHSQNASRDAIQIAINEAKTVGNLRHSNIVPIYDVGTLNDGTFFIVMQYVEGETLRDRLARQKLHPEEARSLLLEVAEAVAYAHAEGVVHRDLKPGNVLLDSSRAYVTDFGLASNEAISHPDGGTAGTLPYMAPEVLVNHGVKPDHRADIWSLGAMLYQMLSGDRPFHGSSRLEIQQQIMFRQPPPLDSDLPVDLVNVCMKCLEKDVHNRYSTARDLCDALERASLATEPTNQRQMLRVAGVAVLIIVASLAILLMPKMIARRDAQSNDASIGLLGDEASGTTAVGSSVAAQVAKPLVGDIDVEVWPIEEPNEVIHNIQDAWPLRQGDQYRIQVSMREEAYVYILWIDSHGIVSPMYPWRYEPQSPTEVLDEPGTSFTIPNSKRGYWTAMQHLPGMDTIVVFARRTPLPAEIHVRDAFRGITPQRTVEHEGVVELHRTDDGMFTQTHTTSGAVLQNQITLAKSFGRHFEFHSAISFPTVERQTSARSQDISKPQLSANVKVLVKPIESPDEPAVSIHEAWPLEAGDQCCIEATFSEPSYPYLFWIDSTGIASSLYPWEWTESRYVRHPERAMTSLRFPADGFEVSHTTPAGMEGPILLLSRTPLPDDFDIRPVFRELQKQRQVEADGIMTFLRIGNNPASLVPKLDGSVLANQQAFHRVFGEYFDLHTAILFPTVKD